MPYRDYGLISVLFLRTILPFKVDSRIYSANLRLFFLAINFNTSYLAERISSCQTLTACESF